jgi:hypothetical protein
VRIPLVLALLGLTASCGWPPPQMPPEFAAPVSLTPPPAGALVPAPLPTTPTPVVAATPGAPVGAPVVEYVPLPLLYARWLNAAPAPGRFTLSNFSFPSARIQVVFTSERDCTPPPVTAATDFVLPLNGTRIIEVPPGADVCWRRELPPATAQVARPAPPWTEWNRAYTASGRFFDSRF